MRNIRRPLTYSGYDYSLFWRMASPSASGRGTVGGEDQEEDKGDPSGCTMPATTNKADWDAYEACEEAYWGASAGDCHTFKKRAEANLPADKQWCASKGGTWPEPCLELAHSCVSTVVCQVFNYLYGNGQFTQECGKYGEPVGDVIWWGSGFQSAAALIGPLLDEIKCIGSDTGSCWPNVASVYGAYALKVSKLIAKLQAIWDAQRQDAGLPASLVCIDIPFLTLAAMIARDEVPSPLSETARQQLLSRMMKGYKIESWSTCNQIGCKCPAYSLGLEEAIVELSLWTDPNGFGSTIHTPQIVFLNQNNWVTATSVGIRSALQLVSPASGVVQTSKMGILGQLPVSPVRLPAGEPSLKLFHGAAQDSQKGYGCAFNIGINQKGGPETCKSISATNDSKVCAGAAQQILQARLDALYRVIPLVVGAMTAHNAHYAMIWQRAHSPIPIPDQNRKDPIAVAVQRSAQQAAGASQDSDSSWLKILLTLGVLGGAGYAAYRYWPK